jgi:cell division protease FtsH
MDGFSSREGIIVLAATNQPDVLDRALLRPGRFDRRVVVNPPDRSGARGDPHGAHARRAARPEVSSPSWPRPRRGSPAPTCATSVNEAALLAARGEREQRDAEGLPDALEKIVLGPERPLVLTRADRERIAYHEGGHAVLGLVVPGADPGAPRDDRAARQALGVTYQRPMTDRYNYPEAYLRARIVGMLGRRARPRRWSTAPRPPAPRATSSRRRGSPDMVTRWGMSAAVGMVQLAPGATRFLRRRRASATTAVQRGDRAAGRRRDPRIVAGMPRRRSGAKRLLVANTARNSTALVARMLERDTLAEDEISPPRLPARRGARAARSPRPRRAGSKPGQTSRVRSVIRRVACGTSIDRLRSMLSQSCGARPDELARPIDHDHARVAAGRVGATT